MASKVFVGVSQSGFYQQGKRRDDVVNLGYVGNTASNPELRVKQLEQNIRFLQEQHQIMLSGLHREVEVLRRRNRDLQFQMVFNNGGITVVDDTSPDDDCTRTITVSPGQINMTPLQIELLERDLAEMKTNLGEARTRNLYLQSVVDDQKKTIRDMENEKSEMAAVGRKISPVTKAAEKQEEDETIDGLKDKLDDSDRMVRRLRRENEEQRKEIVSLRIAVGRAMSDRREPGGYRDRASHPRDSQFPQTSRFPPLFPNNQWNHPRNGTDYNGDRPPNRREGEGHPRPPAKMSLPLLNDRNNGPSTSGYNSGNNGHQGSNHRRGPRGNRSYRNYNKERLN